MRKIDTKKLLIYFSLFLFIFFDPISISIRQAGLIFMLIIFVYEIFSILRKKNVRLIQDYLNLEPILLLIFLFYLILNSVFISIDKAESYDVLINSIWQCFFLYFFITYYLKYKYISIKPIIWFIAISAFVQGIDGIYQFFVGVDFIKGDPAWGKRLTASLDTPRVGNFVSLAIPAFFILYAYSNIRKSLFKILFYTLLLAPPIFLLIFSGTRSGWIGVAAFLIFLLILFPQRKYFYFVFFFFGIVFFLSKNYLVNRLAFEKIINNPRWELWGIGLNLFKFKPITGHGIATFADAFNLYKLFPVQSTNSIPHPHNIYVQFLCELGLIGFILAMLFLGYRLFSLFRLYTINKKNTYIPAVFFSWVVSYMVTAFSAHSFFRTWWLGFFMVIFAITGEYGYRSMTKHEER